MSIMSDPAEYNTPPSCPMKTPTTVEGLDSLAPLPSTEHMHMRESVTISMGVHNEKSLSMLLSGKQHAEVLWSSAEAAEEEISALVSALAACPRLESLKLECCTGADATPIVVAAAASCTHLRHVGVYACHADADEAMAALGNRQTGAPPSLDWCSLSTDEALFELARRGGASLEALNLSPYEEGALTDEAVLAIACFCPRLRSLNLADAAASGGFTDEAITLLAGGREGVRGCAELVNLEIGSSEDASWTNAHLTDTSIGRLTAGALPALETLGLRGCTAVTPRALAALKAARPTLCVEGPHAEVLTASPHSSGMALLAAEEAAAAELVALEAEAAEKETAECRVGRKRPRSTADDDCDGVLPLDEKAEDEEAYKSEVEEPCLDLD
uniref:Uncharacterized protein n=1 Tax=Haptolina brevifila TaxID=156173 RepID=A0A7S2MUW0_9EUKA|mmetsp:Transcript_59311/g.117815  ORF Transcript_59311/g.117815 Transcript_59311/m.117815 type:complete len:387 (+) Transcript_59311:37-1197(+)